METGEAKRRLAAILMADVVGYSRLMGQDDKGTVASLDACRKIFSDGIAHHHGRLVNAPGDSIMAEFGSVVDAVACAVEVQRALAERNAESPGSLAMIYRIGVDLGDVLVKDDALYGDGVNIAARLESLAEPGGICISGKAHAEVKGKLQLSYEFLGKQEVKNIEEAVPVFRVLSKPGAAAHRVVRAGRIAGRKGRLIGLAASVVIVAGVIAVGVYVTGIYDRAPTAEDDPVLAMPTGPTIGVLPFENMTGDPEQEYFSDGITEQIIAELTRFTNIHVLARNSTFQYKGKSVDVREIGTSLGADYVIEGSVRRGMHQGKLLGLAASVVIVLALGIGGWAWLRPPPPDPALAMPPGPTIA
ncbi:MAG: adenylate/guanylate cyclase domain-containing protein, partial [bacterium]